MGGSRERGWGEGRRGSNGSWVGVFERSSGEVSKVRQALTVVVVGRYGGEEESGWILVHLRPNVKAGLACSSNEEQLQ
jgi:hypothetical protein